MPFHASHSARLTLVTLVALTVTTGLSACVVVVNGDASWWPAWIAGTVIGLISAVVTLRLLRPVISQALTVPADGLRRLASIVVAAGIARVVIVAGGILISVKLLSTPTWPTFGFATSQYVLLTITEVWTVSRVFWKSDSMRTGAATAGAPASSH